MKYGMKRVLIIMMLAALIMCLCPAGRVMAGEAEYNTVIQLVGSAGGEVVIAATGTPEGNAESAIGITTTETGLLLLELLSGTTITSITTNSGTYTGSAETGEGTMDEPVLFTKATPTPDPDPDPFPYVVESGPASGYDNSDDGLVIKGAGDYTVRRNENYHIATVPITITAKTGTVNLTLNNVDTQIPRGASSPALWITEGCGADVTLNLLGLYNYLSGSYDCAGVQKDNGDAARLTIDGPGSLTVRGGDNAAGIGGGDVGLVSNIVFAGGNIICKGGYDGAGIGGGSHCSVEGITFTGGTITSTGGGNAAGIGGGRDGTVRDIKFTGGSVNATVPEGTASIPVEIDLAGAGNKTAITQVDIDGLTDAYGLKDVQTMDDVLYLWLPKGAILKSVTAGDKVYTYMNNIIVEGADKWRLRPPQFDARDTEVKLIANTFRDGLTLKTSAVVDVADDIKPAKAPIFVVQPEGQDMGLTFSSMEVDTRDRGELNALRLTTADSGKITVKFMGDSRFSSVILDNNTNYAMQFVVLSGSLINVDGVRVTSPKIVEERKALADIVDLLVDLPGATLENGTGKGEGSYSIVKRGTGNVAMELENVNLSLSGFMPAQFKMTIDENSTLTLKDDAIMVLLDGATITGAGRIQVDGQLIGNAGADTFYRVNASARGGWPLTQSGITNGYAKSGDTVTIGITREEDFIGWGIEPWIEGLDYTQKTISFIADKPYDVEAFYKVKAKGIEFDKSKYEVETGDSMQLKWTLKPKDATDKRVTFASSNPEIAEVDDGLVYGVSSGDAEITITTLDGGFTDTCAITVVDPPVKPLDVPVAAMKLNSSMKLIAPAGYAGAWSTGDEKIAAIVKDNKLKAVALGETTLTFTVNEVVSKRPSLVNGKTLAVGESASVPLMVRKKKELVSSIDLGAKTIYLAPGEEMTLSPTLKPKAALDRDVVYRSGNTRIVRVDGGTLVAMSEGKTNLIATASSFKTKKLSLVVTTKLQKLIPQTNNAKIKVGEVVRLAALTQPLGLEDSVDITWSSKKPGVATVDENGIVKGVKKGKATIVAKNGKKKATFTVTVK